MATAFNDIYNRAIFKFADYSFLSKDKELKEAVLQKYLLSAIADFNPICKIDLFDYDLDAGQFNNDLDDYTKEVLALGVAFYWLSYKTLDTKKLKNVLNSKDYFYYSPANLLKEVQTLRETLYTEFQVKMRKYSFLDSDIGTWTPEGVASS